MNLLRVIDERVKEGPKDRVIERKKTFANGDETDLEPVVIKDNTYHHFVKMNMELLEKMMKQNQNNFESYINSKKSKAGKKGGVNIRIYSNVPRPEKTAIEIEAEKDDGSDS